MASTAAKNNYQPAVSRSHFKIALPTACPPRLPKNIGTLKATSIYCVDESGREQL